MGDIEKSLNNISDSTVQQNSGNNSDNVGRDKVTHNHYNGITDETLQRILKSYEDTIDLLKEKLERTLSVEARDELIQKLTISQNELETKTQELAQLQTTFDQIKPNDTIRLKAKEILESQGVTQAIDYLQSIEAKEEQNRVDKGMKEQAQIFQLEAQLLKVENRYHEAKTAYKSMIRYDRSFDALFEYAYFFQSQNEFREATKRYEEALEHTTTYPQRATTLNNLAVLYKAQNKNKEALEAYSEALTLRRDLAKTNPDVYRPYVATTLNDLAVLYSDENKNKEALEAYSEALTLYRDLAKTNPDVYGVDYAQMLIMGVHYFDRDKQELEEARRILSDERYRDLHRARKLLEFLDSLKDML